MIKLDANLIGLEQVQKVAAYLRILEGNAQNQGTDEQAAALADEVDKSWWNENKHRFLK